MIVYGVRKFGKVDALENGAHVATQFVHIWFVPLIPLKTHLVVSEDGNNYQGIPLPFSFKSLLAAWLRCFLVFSTLGALAVMFAAIAEGEIEGLDAVIAAPIAGVAAAALIATFVLSYRFFKPSPERARELEAKMGGGVDEALLEAILAQAASRKESEASAPPSVTSPSITPAPHVGIEQVRASVEPHGFALTEAPRWELARWSNGATWITWSVDPSGARTIRFEGGDAEGWRRHLAPTLSASGGSPRA